MRPSFLSALTALANVCSASNTTHHLEAPKVVTHDLFRTTRVANASSDVSAAPVTEFLSGISYNMNITMGTPPQNVTVVFDTGSSDLRVNSASSAFCEIGICIDGSFNKTASSSLKPFGTRMGMAHNHTCGCQARPWATDTVRIAGATLPEYVLQVGNHSSTKPQNFLGVGFPSNTVWGAARGNPTYNTTARYMVEAGLIKTESFSVYLAHSVHNDGKVIFGGIDNAHFKGKLQPYPIIPNTHGIHDRLALNISSVSVNGTKTTLAMRALIDTGVPDLKLPHAFIDKLWKAYNVTRVTIGPPGLSMTWGLIDCTMAHANLTADIDLPGLQIRIPFADLVLDRSPGLIANHGDSPSDLPEGQCLFNLNHGGRDIDAYVLGTPFLKSAYAVFNLDTKEISLAKINRDPGLSKITEITATVKTNGTANSTASSTASSLAGSSTGGSISAGSQLEFLVGPAIFSLLSTIALVQGIF